MLFELDLTDSRGPKNDVHRFQDQEYKTIRSIYLNVTRLKTVPIIKKKVELVIDICKYMQSSSFEIFTWSKI
jgi:hypothetical protein